MARASGLAIEVERSAIPVLPATATICGDLGLDPLGLIGSGSLIVGCNPEGAAEIETVFGDSGIPFAWIGRAVAADEGSPTTVPRFPRDELIKTNLMRGIEAVIFDMDGTLVDSSYDWPAIRRRLGVTGASIIDDLNGLPEPDRSRRWAELEEIEATATAEATLHEGAHELLDVLVQHHLSTALVTNNSDANVERPPGSLWVSIFDVDRDPRFRPLETVRRARQRGRQAARYRARSMSGGRRLSLRHPRRS